MEAQQAQMVAVMAQLQLQQQQQALCNAAALQAARMGAVGFGGLPNMGPVPMLPHAALGAQTAAAAAMPSLGMTMPLQGVAMNRTFAEASALCNAATVAASLRAARALPVSAGGSTCAVAGMLPSDAVAAAAADTAACLSPAAPVAEKKKKKKKKSSQSWSKNKLKREEERERKRAAAAAAAESAAAATSTLAAMAAASASASASSSAAEEEEEAAESQALLQLLSDTRFAVEEEEEEEEGEEGDSNELYGAFDESAVARMLAAQAEMTLPDDLLSRRLQQPCAADDAAAVAAATAATAAFNLPHPVLDRAY